MITHQELKDSHVCPNCKDVHVGVVGDVEIKGATPAEDRCANYHVLCLRCGLKTEWFDTIHGAVGAWFSLLNMSFSGQESDAIEFANNR